MALCAAPMCDRPDPVRCPLWPQSLNIVVALAPVTFGESEVEQVAHTVLRELGLEPGADLRGAFARLQERGELLRLAPCLPDRAEREAVEELCRPLSVQDILSMNSRAQARRACALPAYLQVW